MKGILIVSIGIVLAACGSGEEPIHEELPEGLSHVEAGMVDFESCEAGGGEVVDDTCTTFDGRVFNKD